MLKVLGPQAPSPVLLRCSKFQRYRRLKKGFKKLKKAVAVTKVEVATLKAETDIA